MPTNVKDLVPRRHPSMVPTVLMFMSSLACLAAFVLLITLPPGFSSAAAVSGSMLVTIVLPRRPTGCR
jgi:hypothetical protein